MSAGSDSNLKIFSNWLRKLDADVDDIRVSEVLWLAQRIKESTAGANPRGDLAPKERSTIEDNAIAQSTQGAKAEETKGQVGKQATEAGSPGEQKMGASGASSSSAERATAEKQFFAARKGRRGAQALSASTVLLPAAAALPDALAIGRALRPLSRKCYSQNIQELDEEATAESIAHSQKRIYAPVYRPAAERWFDLAIVVEKTTSLDVWQQTIIEFRRLLIHSGVFSDVRLWSLQADDHEVQLFSATGVPHDHRELMQSSGRRLFLIVSDCVSEAWRTGLIPGRLADWAQSTPLAIAQVLPRDMWFRTWLGEPVARLSALRAGLPNNELRVERSHERGTEQPLRIVAAPAFALEAPAISDWARMLMASGGASAEGVLLSASPRGEQQTVDGDAAEFTPEQRVQRFRAMASPEAFRLSTFLSASTLTVPVMRLIQHAMLRTSPTSILAEVLLGGILKREKTPGDVAVSPDEVAYEFFPGVRDVLQGLIRRREARSVLKCVSTFVRDRWGHPLDFTALTPDSLGDQLLPADALPFAKQAADVMQKFRNPVAIPEQRDSIATESRSSSNAESEVVDRSSTVPTAARRRDEPVIFLAFANDRDDSVGYLRNLPDEARRLREVLKPAAQAGLCEVVVRSNSTASDIFQVFQNPEYRDRIAIFHYGGHANGFQLLLESAEGKAAAADAGGLAAFLAQPQGLQLVFLNGCSTQQQTRELLDANISAVISTSRAIDDQVATYFACKFYQGLAGGATIRTSYNEAEASVQTAKGGDTRGLYFGASDDSKSQLEADRWPWNLYLREGSENADQWNLSDAANDPLFGLPRRPHQDLPESPYRHLTWFTRNDAEVFFGRGHQIRELYERLTAPSTPMILFYGQAGVGKSSILAAGLIPRLEQAYEVRYLRRAGGGLLDTLQDAFLSEDVPIETAWQLAEEQSGKPLIVFLDQVEELYTRPIADLPDELDQLLKVVQATFVQPNQRPRGKLVLGFRKEWLAELEAQLVAYELPRTKVFLEPLARQGIIEIVQGPARSERLRERYGLTVEDGLAEIIADDLLADRDSVVAPTLQILLTKMWTMATEENYEHPQFTQELYQHLKRDGILLRDFLNQQIAAFRQRYPEAVESGLLLDILALRTTQFGTADQTVEFLQELYAHIGDSLQGILQLCQDLYLLTVAVGTRKVGSKTTRLAHDMLAPIVREQLEVSDRPGQRVRRLLDYRSRDWEEGREGTPLDEAELKLVEQGVNGTRVLNQTEQRMLAASRDARKKRDRWSIRRFFK